MDRRVQKAIDLIKEDLRRELPLTVLARSVNLSASRLRHLFAAEIGMTPAQYRKYIKMQEAKELAENTFLNAKQIMNRIGMSNESHFARDMMSVRVEDQSGCPQTWIKESKGLKVRVSSGTLSPLVLARLLVELQTHLTSDPSSSLCYLC